MRGVARGRGPEREGLVELARAGFVFDFELVGNLVAGLVAPNLGPAERGEGVNRDRLVHVAAVPSPFGGGRVAGGQLEL